MSVPDGDGNSLAQQTDRDDKYHGILLAGELFACRCQSWIPNRNKLETRRRLSLVGVLRWVGRSAPGPAQAVGGLGCRQFKSTSISNFFFFLSLFWMNSNHDLCPELILGLSGLATKPGGKGAAQSITLPLRSLLCRSLACSPAPTPGAVRFSLPISTGNHQYPVAEHVCREERPPGFGVGQTGESPSRLLGQLPGHQHQALFGHQDCQLRVL